MSPADQYKSALTNHTNKDLHLVVLVDGSGSVVADDFNTTKDIVKRFVAECTADASEVEKKHSTFITVVQFSDTVKVVLDNVQLNSEENASIAKDLIDAMDQLKEGTSYVRAYEAAKTVLNRVGSNYTRKIVMITDGQPADPIEVVQGWVRSFNQKAIEVYVIGIGAGVPISTIERVSSPGCGFHYNNYGDLAQNITQHITSITKAIPARTANSNANTTPVNPVLPGNNPAPKPGIDTSKLGWGQCFKYMLGMYTPEREPAEPSFEELKKEFNMQLVKDKRDLFPCDKFEAKVEIVSGNKATIPPNRYAVVFVENNHFMATTILLDKPIEEKVPTAFPFTLTPKATATDDTFPSEVRWELRRVDSDDIVHTGFVQFKTEWLVAEHKTERPIHVILFGEKQAGKSSFINGALTSMATGDKIRTDCQVFSRKLGEQAHGTTGFKKFPFSNLSPHADVQFVFWDIWGLSDTTFKSIDILPFLKGEVSAGVSIDENKPDVLQNNDPAGYRHNMDVVVFFANYNSKDTPDKHKALKENVVKAQREGYSPLLVVTYIDAVADVREHSKIKKEFAQLSGVDGSLVFVHSNYHGTEKTRDPKVDFSTRQILLAIKRVATERFAQEPPTTVNVNIKNKEGKLVRVALGVPIKYGEPVHRAINPQVTNYLTQVPAEKDITISFLTPDGKEVDITDQDLKGIWGEVTQKYNVKNSVSIVAAAKASDSTARYSWWKSKNEQWEIKDAENVEM